VTTSTPQCRSFAQTPSTSWLLEEVD
jgi:hypothetical protein